MKQKRRKKAALCTVVAATVTVSSLSAGSLSSRTDIQADSMVPLNKAAITEELTAKRTRFTKQFALSDGSYTAVTYSMPVHYKRNGKWKEINTTLVKSGKKKYKTKATDLSIQVSKKANKKSLVSLKRGKTSLSLALQGKKLKPSKVKLKNPRKTTDSDVLNQNKATYKKVLKNTSVSYVNYTTQRYIGGYRQVPIDENGESLRTFKYINKKGKQKKRKGKIKKDFTKFIPHNDDSIPIC